LLHLVSVKADLSYYLDRPEEFGRFYVVARIYSGLWGLVGIWAVFRLATRFSDRLIVPAGAAVCFLLMPIVINGTHEAKPHLAGTVLILLSALAATKYVETGRPRWWVVTGVLCGLAVGMVLSAAVAFVILPLMALLRPMPWGRRAGVAAGAAALGVLAYCITNPYVPLNLLRDPTVVRENLSALSKAKAIVGRTSDAPALQNARTLIVDGASVVGGVFGLIGVLLAAVNRRWWGAHPRARSVTVLLGVPAALVLIQFVSLAGGKTGEFGRFAVLPDVALVLVAVVSVYAMRISRRWPGPIFATLVLLTGLQGLAYLRGFWADTRHGQTTRDVAARQLEELYARGARTLGVRADPAPYCLPPVDLTRWKILLLPADGSIPDGAAAPDVIVFPVDDLASERQVAGTPYVRTGVPPRHSWGRTRISWADKPFEIRTRRGLAPIP
jgi:4-amino-4-deoxy-L-arabinose transferase-like glycosyltransferase